MVDPLYQQTQPHTFSSGDSGRESSPCPGLNMKPWSGWKLSFVETVLKKPQSCKNVPASMALYKIEFIVLCDEAVPWHFPSSCRWRVGEEVASPLFVLPLLFLFPRTTSSPPRSSSTSSPPRWWGDDQDDIDDLKRCDSISLQQYLLHKAVWTVNYISELFQNSISELSTLVKGLKAGTHGQWGHFLTHPASSREMWKHVAWSQQNWRRYVMASDFQKWCCFLWFLFNCPAFGWIPSRIWPPWCANHFSFPTCSAVLALIRE